MSKQECRCCGETKPLSAFPRSRGRPGLKCRRCKLVAPDVIPPIEERFHEAYTPEPNTGCWLWLRGAARLGYGLMGRRGASVLAHRLSWEIHRGEIPAGLSVCHRCDVPACVNPDHLFLGTHAENMRDRDRKGRGRKGQPGLPGVANPQARLTPEHVRLIRESTKSIYRLARDLGISESAARRVRRGETWKHV